MDEQVKKEEDEKAFQERKAEQEKKDREKTDKNRAKRERQRARKAKQKKGPKSANAGEVKEATPGPDADKTKKKLAPSANTSQPACADDDDYIPNEGGEVKNADEIGLIIEDDD